VYTQEDAKFLQECGIAPGIGRIEPPECSEPVLTHQDALLLEAMGIAAPKKMPGNMTCAQCGVQFRTGIDFLILASGEMICGESCTP